METNKWNVIATRVPAGQGRDLLRSIIQRANPHLTTSEIETALIAPMTVASAVTTDAANALMQELEEQGIPTRKLRVVNEPIPEPPEEAQPRLHPRYCTTCGAPLEQQARFCSSCGGEVSGYADSLKEPMVHSSGSSVPVQPAGDSLAEQEDHRQPASADSITPASPSKPIIVATGYKGSVELYPDRIRILRENAVPGLREGEQEIPLSNIGSVHFKDISIGGNGIIQFLSPGESPLNNAILALLADNALTFYKEHREAFLRFAKAVNDELAKRPEGSVIKIRPCRDCGKDVSVHASSCPHCGAPAPIASPEVMALAEKVQGKITTVKAATSGLGCLIWAAVALFFLYLFFHLR